MHGTGPNMVFAYGTIRLHMLTYHQKGSDTVNTKLEKMEDNKVKVNVETDAKEVDRAVSRVYKDLAKKYSFPGFRKGKAPRPVIDNAVGRESILASATEDLVNELYPRVIEEERLSPVGSPDFGDPGMVDSGKPFAFEFTISVKPEVELSSYEPVSIEIPFEKATEKEIDGQVEALADHYKTYENASSDTPLEEGRAADIKMVAKKADGQEIAALTSDSMLYSLASGLYSDELDSKIKGMKEGEDRTFTLHVPDDETAMLMADLAGQDVTFDVACLAVKTETVPEVTDEWAKETLGFDDVETMRKEIAASLEQQKAQIIPQIKENASAAELVKRVSAEVPDAMAEQMESDLLQDFFTQLQRAGMTFDAYLQSRGIDNDEFKEDVKQQAQDEVKRVLALDAWARNKGIEATDEDVTLEFERAGVDEPAKLERQWREQGRLYLIRDEIVRAKAMEDVLETAKITETDFAEKDPEE